MSAADPARMTAVARAAVRLQIFGSGRDQQGEHRTYQRLMHPGVRSVVGAINDRRLVEGSHHEYRS